MRQELKFITDLNREDLEKTKDNLLKHFPEKMIDIQAMNVANEKDIIDIKNKFQNESISRYLLTMPLLIQK